MKLRHLLSLSLLLALPAALAETADDIFHGGAVNYLSNNIPKALEVVTNGRSIFPDDLKLKKLEELLKQQNQQQQQQNDEQKKQDEKQDQQSNPDQKDEQKKNDEEKSQKQSDKKEQEKQQAKSSDDKSKEKPADEQEAGQPQPAAAHAMTPQEAKQLLDAQKGDEKVLQFMPQGEPKSRERLLKDW